MAIRKFKIICRSSHFCSRVLNQSFFFASYNFIETPHHNYVPNCWSHLVQDTEENKCITSFSVIAGLSTRPTEAIHLVPEVVCPGEKADDCCDGSTLLERDTNTFKTESSKLKRQILFITLYSLCKTYNRTEQSSLTIVITKVKKGYCS
jgi:hypothetical protein